MEIKDKVFHTSYGAGIVEKTKNNGAIIGVDFKGIYKEVGKAELQPPKKNAYIPKEKMMSISIDELDEFIKDFKENNTPYSTGAVIGVESVKEYLLNK